MVLDFVEDLARDVQSCFLRGDHFELIERSEPAGITVNKPRNGRVGYHPFCFNTSPAK